MSTQNTYATLMETNCEYHESWYTFIRWQGNEETLQSLRKQLESVEWHCEDEENMESSFDLDTDYLVSEETARDMTKLDMNSVMFHRKFDGKMQPVELNLEVFQPSENMNRKTRKRKASKVCDRNIMKVNRILAMGRIDVYLEDEDVPHREAEDSNCEHTSSEHDSDDSEGSEDSDDVEDVSKTLDNTHLPSSLKI